MATIYGAQLYKSPTKATNYQPGNIIGTNDAIFHVDDPVSIDATLLEVAETTDPIVGICNKTQTMSHTNETVALVCPGYMPIDQDYEFLMGTTADLAVSDVGKYSTISGGTGAVQVTNSTNASPSGKDVLITQLDPWNIGGTGADSGLRMVVVKFINLLNLR